MEGIALDSSVFISAERKGLGVAALFRRIREITPTENVAMTAVGMTEVVHGIYRADTPARAAKRNDFLREVSRFIPVLAYTAEIAELVGRIDGEQTSLGNIIPSVDLLIGGTALYHHYAILTTNLRHFRKIPGLEVVAF